jgi:hypothetical protein
MINSREIAPGDRVRSRAPSSRFSHIVTRLRDHGFKVWTQCSNGFYAREMVHDDQTPLCKRCAEESAERGPSSDGPDPTISKDRS